MVLRSGGPQSGWDGVPGTDTPAVSPQKPILLQGHERSITQIKYNREGDLLFTVAKDPVSRGAREGGRAGRPEGRVRTVGRMGEQGRNRLRAIPLKSRKPPVPGGVG